MKKIFLVILFLSILFSQEWEIQKFNIPEEYQVDAGIASVYFVDENNGWVVSNFISHTEDGGKTWNVQDIPDSSYALRDICFVDAQNGWAVGCYWDYEGMTGQGNGVVLHTTNGGVTWNIQLHSSNWTIQYDLFSVYFKDLKIGWVVGDGLIFSTKDGGVTWDVNFTTQLYSICFYDDNCWAVGTNGFIINNNNDEQWVNQRKDNEKPTDLPRDSVWTTKTNTFYDVYFTDKNNGWVVGAFTNDTLAWVNNRLTWFSGNWMNATILHTNDGGLTWNEQLLEEKTSFYSVYFINSKVGWVTGRGNLYYTDNGGETWDKQYLGTYFGFGSLSFVENENNWIGHASGNDMILSITIDKSITNINYNIDFPETFKLFQNYPNPFNASTTIEYFLPEIGIVDLSIYNLLGQRVFTISEIQFSGNHKIVFNAKDLPSGTYFYQIRTENYNEIKKMVLLK